MNELRTIMTAFAESGWDLIAKPAAAYLNGEYDREALIAAIRQADAECLRCCKESSWN